MLDPSTQPLLFMLRAHTQLLQSRLILTIQPLLFMLVVPIQPLQAMLDPVSQPLQVMIGAVSQPLWFMLKTIHQPLRVILTLLKRLPVQNTSPSFLVSFVRETTLLINALPLQRWCEEFGFMVILFLNILMSLNNQPLLVRLDLVTEPLVFMLGEKSQPL